MSSSLLRLSALALFCAALAACGGSAAPAAQETTTPAKSSLAPLPTDAWAVVPDGARSFLFADVQAARGTAHFAYARQWLAAACFSPEQRALLLDETDRIVAAQWPADASGGPERSALVAQGRFDDADVERALEIIESARDAKTPSTEKVHGRFRMRLRGAIAAARIGDALLVAGDAAIVEKAFALAEGGQGRLRDGELITRTGVGSELGASTALLVLSPDEAPLRRVSRMLGSVGLPKDAVAGTSVVTARVAEGVALEARIMKDDAGSAQRVADAVRAKLGQIGFLARLAGLPPILDKLQVQAEGSVLRAGVEASASDLAALDARLREQYGAAECAQ